MVVVPAAIEGAALSVALAPFVLHRWDMYRWDRDHRRQHVPKGTNHNEHLTVLLPVWNEERIIEKKLDNLAAQKFPMSLLLIDSASTDATVECVEAWLDAHPDAFLEVALLRMDTRQGKTAAVVKALKHLGQHAEGLVCMTDADAMLEQGCLHRMMQWFADPMVGAVGAVPNREGARHDENMHRTAWEAMRLAESMVDSTPFLEGSCMMWRPSCLAIDDLNPSANADDAQIATSIRCRGWRTLTDPLAQFVDAAPSTIKGQRRQKIRRAQGLQRLLTRQRKQATARSQGLFGRIFRRQHHFHIVAPLALTVATTSAILRWGFIVLYGWPATFTLANSLHLGFTVLETVCAALWWRSRQGKSSGPLSLIGQWFASMELLGRSLVITARGRSLHQWEQHADVRERMLDVEV
ncbi:MAG: glycosyltransferase [Candidatus Poseidonia sp.]|nr:glycosyltransferase [Poseidonia sp.]